VFNDAKNTSKGYVKVESSVMWKVMVYC